MKSILLFQFWIISFCVAGQCHPSTFATDVYYPNSTHSPTTYTGYEYLCGPNTVVYDTLEQGCHFIYVNALCTLFLKPTIACNAQSEVWLKSNSTLNVVQGTPGLLKIYYEAGAVINNPSAVTIYSTICTSISFPTINCTTTAILESINESDLFEIYPNPATTVLTIVQNNSERPSQVDIINCLGQMVKEELLIGNKRFNVSIADLPNGIYTVNLFQQAHRSSKRLVISK